MTLPTLPWERRPIEVANLLNPAFGAILIRDATLAYQKAADVALPYPLAFLILPLALHPRTRQALPRSTAALLHTWLEQNAVIHAEATDRIRRLEPYVREAVVFGLQQRLLRITDDGALENARLRMKNPFPAESDPAQCRSASEFLGRWFGKAGDAAFLFSLWGIRP